VLRELGGSRRAAQALAAIDKRPGITGTEIAKGLKIKPNYLYRVIGDLEKG
jgi:DNA-binding MarR family transcriptional regulator